MPADLVKGKDAERSPPTSPTRSGKPPAAAATGLRRPAGDAPRRTRKNVVEIPADPTGQLAYKFKSATAKPGKVTLVSKNDSPVPHNIALKDAASTSRARWSRAARPRR